MHTDLKLFYFNGWCVINLECDSKHSFYWWFTLTQAASEGFAKWQPIIPAQKIAVFLLFIAHRSCATACSYKGLVSKRLRDDSGFLS